ncbi:hypothetical protein COO60DRAFT_608551 [Scenedesmus sp. NREL 46B-D3]|nr:hypothetical protein COO60DRAFT_608551 [Scenedesmus sp. NREL 46B-D3]
MANSIPTTSMTNSKSAASLTPSNMTIAAAVLSGLLQRHSMALASRHVSARHGWHVSGHPQRPDCNTKLLLLQSRKRPKTPWRGELPKAPRLIEESYMGVHVGNGTLRGLQCAGHENKPQKASEKQFAASSPKITQTLRREKASGRNKKVSTSAK